MFTCHFLSNYIFLIQNFEIQFKNFKIRKAGKNFACHLLYYYIILLQNPKLKEKFLPAKILNNVLEHKLKRGCSKNFCSSFKS